MIRDHPLLVSKCNNEESALALDGTDRFAFVPRPTVVIAVVLIFHTCGCVPPHRRHRLIGEPLRTTVAQTSFKLTTFSTFSHSRGHHRGYFFGCHLYTSTID